MGCQPLDPAQIMALQAQLDDARKKLHQLLTGRLAVEILADGYTVKYTAAKIPDLRAWISELEERIDGGRVVGGIGIIF